MSDKTSGIGRLTYEIIRKDIILGKLPSGSKLKMSFLKQHYSASMLVLRNVLHSLSDEGFVVAKEQRGFYVAPLSKKNLIELADLRYLLESHMIEISFSLSSVEWESHLLAVHHKLQRLEDQYLKNRSNAEELIELKLTDYEFHYALISGCNSSELLSVYKTIFDKYLRYLFHFDAFRGVAARQEHKQLLDSALSQNTEQAQNILKQHIYECVNTIVKMLEEKKQ